jgi:hypothetical protein
LTFEEREPGEAKQSIAKAVTTAVSQRLNGFAIFGIFKRLALATRLTTHISGVAPCK